MATGQDILDVVKFDLLEDGGLVLGLLTNAQFLDMLNLTVTDLCMKSGVFSAIDTQRIVANQAQYTIPESIMRIDAAFCSGRIMAMTTTTDLNTSCRGWRNADPFIPERWRTDQVGVKQVAVFPPPNYTGQTVSGASFWPSGVSPLAHRDLTLVGLTAPAALTDLSQTIGLLSDDIAVACLPSGVEERIFASDSELKDIQRSMYCGAQYREMVNCLAAFMDEMEDDPGAQ